MKIQIGLSASTIASSFGKVTSANKDLEECKREDIALSLLRMISYNISQVHPLNLDGSKSLYIEQFVILNVANVAQIAYLNALRYGLKRIFFGGFFIRGHAYTMDTISFAVGFWYVS
jgi:type II pantothenate kinase